MRTAHPSFALIPILLLAAALRFGGAGWSARFHPDEAWFATFARSAAVHGAWWLPGALDKTPLAIYAQALSMALFAADIPPTGMVDVDIYRGEEAARLPSALAGIVTTAAIYALARRLYGRRAGAAAALAAALSPYGIAYSASGFTDGMMVMCGALALASAQPTTRGAAWAGAWTALALACKQQGLYFAPLCLLLLPVRRWAAFALALGAGAGALLAWDAARAAAGAAGVGIFVQAAANNDPERFFPRPDELIPRLSAWLRFFPSLVGIPAAWGALLLAARPRPQRMTHLFAAAIVVYLLAHWLLRFNTYDRYLLPLLPLTATLTGALLAGVRRRGMALLVAALLAVGAWHAYSGHIAIGGAASAQRDDGRAYDGIDRVAAYLDQLAVGAIVYDRWLGWQLDYYLGAWTNKRRVYYPTPAQMAHGAAAQPDPAPRYFPVPLDAPYSAYLAALRRAGFTARPVLEVGAFRIYELLASAPAP